MTAGRTAAANSSCSIDSAKISASTPRTSINRMAGTGTAVPGDTRRNTPLAGKTLSRAMAYTSRDPEAMMISPQANTETMTSTKNSSDIVGPSFIRMISGSG